MQSETLQSIQNLPLDCVFGLISDSNKECYISHTTNLRTRIGQILSDNVVTIKDDTRLVVFCSGFAEGEYKRIFSQYYVNMYNVAEYKILGNVSEYINYRIKIEFSEYLNEAFVMLINRRKDKRIMGVFRTIKEADEFIAQYYSGDLVQPVYAINRETREWYINGKRSSKPKN